MTIRVKCPGCQQTLKAEPRHAGRTVRCPACSAAVTIPPPADPAPDEVLDPFADLAASPSAPPPAAPPPRQPAAKAPASEESATPASPGQPEISEDEVGDWLLEGLDNPAGVERPAPTDVEPIVETPNWDGVSSTYDVVEGGSDDPPPPRRTRKRRGT